MRVLVTGAAGFIGSNFVLRTLSVRQNVEIIAYDCLSYAGNLDNLKPVIREIEFVRGDIRDTETLTGALKGCDLLVNFAAESHNDNSLSYPDLFFSVNTIGTLSVMRACLDAGVRLHHVSTDEVYGDMDLLTSDRFQEESPYRPSSPYSASKASADLAVRAWHRSFGLAATISNCSNNYGPKQNVEKLIPSAINRLKNNKRPRVYGSGENVRDWIHVDDHVDGIWAVIEKGKSGDTYLLGAEDEVRNLDLVRGLSETMGFDRDFVEFVEDRPGHDRRYAIDPAKALKELSWRAKRGPILSSLDALVEEYL